MSDTTLYIVKQDTRNRRVIAIISGDEKDCFAVAEREYADTDRFSWTLTPALGTVDAPRVSSRCKSVDAKKRLAQLERA